MLMLVLEHQPHRTRAHLRRKLVRRFAILSPSSQELGLAKGPQLVGVMFSDWEPDLSLLQLMRQAGFAGAMLDTAKKGRGRLLNYVDIVSLAEFARRCRAHRLLAAWQALSNLPMCLLLLLAPDYLG
jgi:(5-formylfuran-3-yl)methyl phosphate synthase